MRNVIIENEVLWKLSELHDYLLIRQGIKKGEKTFTQIIATLDSLASFGNIGRNIKDTFNIDCPDNWFLLYCHMNYFVLSRTATTITVLKMYNNQQDFIFDLFGIEMRSQASKDFWGE